jgi:hypothetical protein
LRRPLVARRKIETDRRVQLCAPDIKREAPRRPTPACTCKAESGDTYSTRQLGSQQRGQSVFLSLFPSSLGYTRAANEAESVVQLAHCAQMVVVACSSALVPAGRTVYASPHLRLIIFHYHQSERMPTDQCILLARFGRDAWLGLASRPPKTAPEETSELAGEHVAGCADVSAAARPPRHTGMAGVNDDGATPLFFLHMLN